jgi:predicted Ser/Thr protein kinase
LIRNGRLANSTTSSSSWCTVAVKMVKKDAVNQDLVKEAEIMKVGMKCSVHSNVQGYRTNG